MTSKPLEYTATLNGAKDGMVQWLININGQTFTYGEGIGHYVTDKHPFKRYKEHEKVIQAIAEYVASVGKANPRNIQGTMAGAYKPTARLTLGAWQPVNGSDGLGQRVYKPARVDHNGNLLFTRVEPPKLDAVLYCLVSDAEAENMGHAEWCDTFGYNTDSRQGLALYLACQDTAAKLRKAGVDIATERERLADY